MLERRESNLFAILKIEISIFERQFRALVKAMAIRDLLRSLGLCEAYWMSLFPIRPLK